MPNRMTVMISSTREDLKPFRAQAKAAIEQWGGVALVMENLPAGPEDAISASLKLMDEAEIYIGIFAHRYGYIPDSPRNSTHLSITEMEYRWAIERDLPMLIFLMAEGVPIDPIFVEKGEGAVKLEAFKKSLKPASVIGFFNSPEDLRADVLHALHALHAPKSANGHYQPAPPPNPDDLPERGFLPPGVNFATLPNENFVGREADLKAIARALLYRPNGKPIGITAAMGAGGIGKTQLAIEFAYRYGRFFHGVHWLSAVSDRLDPEIAACGYAMNLPEFPDTQEVQIQRVLAEWAKHAPRLIIVDNAEKPDVLKEWLPRLQGQRVLITSRRGQWPSQWGVIAHRLDVLTPDESRALLRRLAAHLVSVPDAKLDEIGKKLGYLPLALDLAGRYIEGRKMTPTAFLGLLDKQKSVLDHKSFTTWAEEAGLVSSTDHNRNLYASFDLSWQRLKSEPAKRALIGCGYLAPNTPIPMELLTALFKNAADPAETVDMALLQLDNVGLLSRKEDGLPAIHPLIADFGRLQAKKRDDALAVLTTHMGQLSNQANATGLPANFAPLRAHIERLAEQAESAGHEDAGWLWNNLGYHLHHMVADYAGARAAYERAIGIGEKMLGPNHPDVATRVNNLGGVLQETGDLAGAKALYERALRIDEKTYGPDHPNVAICVNNLGLVLQEIGVLPEAKGLYERALRIDEKTYGPHHPKVAIRVNNLGLVLQEMGELAAAKALYERALRIDEKTYGPDHPEVASDVNNLGGVLQEMDDLPAAQALFERALRIDEKTYGQNHPTVARDVHNLGTLDYAMGHLAGAKVYLERALRIFRQFLPAGHADIQAVQGWLDDVNRELTGDGL